ncbi:MAG TPA: hypothetical protein VIJ38_03895 [Acidobacteriaceae bacterium]
MKPFPGTVTAYAPGTKTPSPFAFVLNISELVGRDAVEIIPGRIMRRANEAEIKFIKDARILISELRWWGTLGNAQTEIKLRQILEAPGKAMALFRHRVRRRKPRG